MSAKIALWRAFPGALCVGTKCLMRIAWKQGAVKIFPSTDQPTHDIELSVVLRED